MQTKSQNISKKVIKCNCCGQAIKPILSTDMHEDYLIVHKEWGYFSDKDMTEHKFNICESCYDRWVETFELPIKSDTVNDLFRGIS